MLKKTEKKKEIKRLFNFTIRPSIIEAVDALRDEDTSRSVMVANLLKEAIAARKKVAEEGKLVV